MYGEPGAGKTYLCGTAQDNEETRPLLFLDVEGGSMTLRRRPDVDVIQIRSMQEIINVGNELFKNPGYYRTVVIDSLTELQKLDLQTVIREMKSSSSTPDRIDEDVPDQRSWGKSGMRIGRIVRFFKDLPVNTIATCLLATEWEKDDRNRDTATVKLFYPALPGKLRSEIPGYFDVVGFMKAEAPTPGTIVRSLQVTKTKKVIAKDRTGSLGQIVNEPSIPLMWSTINDSNQVENKT